MIENQVVSDEPALIDWGTGSACIFWAYVKSSENPADTISRGCDAEQISGINLWWNGPEWLKNNIEEWPITEKTSQNDNIEMLPE